MAGCRATSPTSTRMVRRRARCGPISASTSHLLAIACADATSFFFILAVSNCRLHYLQLPEPQFRLDPPHRQRPHLAPVACADLAAGARNDLRIRQCRVHGRRRQGLEPACARGQGCSPRALIIPVFWFRHYVQDKGRFPEHMLDDLNLTANDMDVSQGGHLAVPYARCRPRCYPHCKLVFPVAGLKIGASTIRAVHLVDWLARRFCFYRADQYRDRSNAARGSV